MLLAAKIGSEEEDRNMSVTLDRFSELTDRSSSIADIAALEVELMTSFDWQVEGWTSYHYLLWLCSSRNSGSANRGNVAGPTAPTTSFFACAQCLLEGSVLCNDLCRFQPNELAAAAWLLSLDLHGHLAYLPRSQEFDSKSAEPLVREEPGGFRITGTPLLAEQHCGIGFRVEKAAQSRSPYQAHVRWGELVLAEDVGDGWIRVQVPDLPLNPRPWVLEELRVDSRNLEICCAEMWAHFQVGREGFLKAVLRSSCVALQQKYRRPPFRISSLLWPVLPPL